jgi:formylmethanofuran dehydrogenase subunit A
VVKPEFDRGIEKDIKKYFDAYHTVKMEHVKVTDQHIADDGRGHVTVQECKGRREKTA